MAIVGFLITAYVVAIVLVIIFSWFPQSPGSPLFQVFVFLRRITDPVLGPVRRTIPPIAGTIDLSPTIVIIGLLFLKSVLGA